MKSKRMIYKNVFLICLISFIFLISEILCYQLMKLELTCSYNNKVYNKNTVFFIMSSEDSEFVDLSEIKNEEILAECVLLKYNEEPLRYNEVIYCSKNVVNLHESENIHDFDSKSKVAIAGKNSSYEIGEYFYCEGCGYLIEDILDEHISLGINEGVFFTKSNLEKVPLEKTYMITSRDKGKNKKAFENLGKFLKQKDVSIKEIYIRDAILGDYISYSKIMKILLIVLLIFYLGAVFAFRYFWIKSKLTEIYVLNMLGNEMTKKKIIIEYLLLWLVSYLINLLIIFGGLRNTFLGEINIIPWSLCFLVGGYFSTIGIYNREILFVKKYNLFVNGEIVE